MIAKITKMAEIKCLELKKMFGIIGSDYEVARL